MATTCIAAVVATVTTVMLVVVPTMVCAQAEPRFIPVSDYELVVSCADRTYASSCRPKPLAAVDLDGDPDGTVDLLFVEPQAGRLYVAFGSAFHGELTVTYRHAHMIHDTTFVNSGAVGEFTGDGALDIVIMLGSLNGPLYALQNNNNGAGVLPTWSSTEVLIINEVIETFSVGNVDADAFDDLVMVDSSTPGALKLVRTTGPMTWAAPVTLASETYIADQRLVDIDNDGDLDVVFRSWPSGNMLFRGLINSGSGTFGSAVTLADVSYVYWGYFEVGDLDNDNLPDIAVFEVNLEIWKNMGGLSFASAHRFPSLNEHYASYFEDYSYRFGRPWIGDVNGDGQMDLVMSSYGSNTHMLLNSEPDQIVFSSEPIVVATGDTALSTGIKGDVRGFGFTDMIVTASMGYDSGVYSNGIALMSPKLFDREIPMEMSEDSYDSFRRGGYLDLHGDGIIDGVTAMTRRAEVGFVTIDASKDVRNALVHHPGPACFRVFTGDWNADGLDDVGCPQYAASTTVSIYLQNPPGSPNLFADPITVAAGANVHSLAALDINLDGAPDLLLNPGRVVMGDPTAPAGTAAFLPPVLTLPVPSISGASTSARVQPCNLDDAYSAGVCAHVAESAVVYWPSRAGHWLGLPDSQRPSTANALQWLGDPVVITTCPMWLNHQSEDIQPAYVDWNNDGMVDIIGPALYAIRGASVCLQGPPGVFVQQPTGESAGPYIAKHEFRVEDINEDGVFDILGLPASEASMTSLSLAGSLSYNTFRVYKDSGLAVKNLGKGDVFLLDMTGNGLKDVVSAAPDQYIAAYTRSPVWGTRHLPSSRVVRVDECGYTIRCIMRSIMRTSPSLVDTVYVPQGLYTGCSDTGLVIRHSVHIAPLPAGRTVPGLDTSWPAFAANVSQAPFGTPTRSVLIDCAGSGGLFVVTSGAMVTLTDMEIAGARAPSRVSEGVLGPFGPLSVTGFGSRLALRHVTMIGTANEAGVVTGADAPSGSGGAVAVGAGATLVVDSVVIANASAGVDGGAIAAVGAGAHVVVAGSLDISFCTAHRSGGGIAFVDAQAEVPVAPGRAITLAASPGLWGNYSANEWLALSPKLAALSGAADAPTSTTVSVTGCTAGGHGGAVFVGSGKDTLTAVSDLLLAFDGALHIQDNSAGGFGGGLYLAGAATPSSTAIALGLGNATSRVVSNTATGGGGVALVAGPVDAAGSLDTVDARLVQLSAGEARDLGLTSTPGAVSPIVGDTELRVRPQAPGAGAAPALLAPQIVDDTNTSAALRFGALGVGGNVAYNGGALFSCGLSTVLQVSGTGSGSSSMAANEATSGTGSTAYACVTVGDVVHADERFGMYSTSSGGPLTIHDVPWVTARDGNTVGAFGTGGLGSAVASLRLTEAPDTRVASGVALTAGRADLFDVFGAPAGLDAVTLSMRSAAGFPPSFLLTNAPNDAHWAGGLSLVGTKLAVTGAQFAGVTSSVFVEASTAVIDATTPLAQTVQRTHGLRLEVSVVLDACPPGSGAVITTALSCEPCPGRTASNTTGMDGCAACPDGAFDVGIGALGCDVCPSGTYRTLAWNASAVDPSSVPPVASGAERSVRGVCFCFPGRYTVSGMLDTECVACPDGATCDGDLSQPLPLPGYAKVSDDGEPYQFAECNVPEACVGGSQACATGYSGYMCSVCTKDYYVDGQGRCTKCPSTPAATFSLMWVLLVVVAAGTGVGIVVTGRSALKSAGDHEGGAGGVAGSGERMSKIPHSISIAVVFLQILAVLGKLEISWPSSVERSLNSMGVLNFDMAIFASACSVPGFDAKYVMTMVVPLLFAVVALVVACAAAWLWARHDAAAGHVPMSMSPAFLAVRLGSLLGPLFYISLARGTLVFFDCTKFPNGTYYLDIEPSRQCFDGQWWRLFPLALAGLLVYVLAIPGLIVGALALHRDRLAEDMVIARYGSLYRVFRSRFWFYEAALLAKRLGVVVAALFVSRVQTLQIALLFVTFFAFTLFQLGSEPYFETLYNTLELRLNVSLTVILALGFTFYANKFPSSEARTGFIVVTLAAIFVSMAVIALAIVKEALLIIAIRKSESSKAVVASETAAWRRGELVMQRIVHELADMPPGQVKTALTKAVTLYRSRGASGASTGVEMSDLGPDDAAAMFDQADEFAIFGESPLYALDDVVVEE